MASGPGKQPQPLVEDDDDDDDEGEELALPTISTSANPYILLGEDAAESTDAEDEAASAPSLETGEEALSLLASGERLRRQLAHQPPRLPAWEGSTDHAIGGRMAHRVMRDALALQLARRGYDGLCQQALWLVTELAADFLKALGAQLQREGPAQPRVPPLAIVRRIQRHANLHGLSDWRQVCMLYTRAHASIGTHAHAHGMHTYACIHMHACACA